MNCENPSASKKHHKVSRFFIRETQNDSERHIWPWTLEFSKLKFQRSVGNMVWTRSCQDRVRFLISSWTATWKRRKTDLTAASWFRRTTLTVTHHDRSTLFRCISQAFVRHHQCFQVDVQGFSVTKAGGFLGDSQVILRKIASLSLKTSKLRKTFETYDSINTSNEWWWDEIYFYCY